MRWNRNKLVPIVAACLTTGLILLTAQAGLADYRTGNGTGGRYAYELWRVQSNSRYRLMVWQRSDYPSGQPLRTFEFESGQKALDYFDCKYGERPLPQCPEVLRNAGF
jgi:hypothetical protein